MSKIDKILDDLWVIGYNCGANDLGDDNTVDIDYAKRELCEALLEELSKEDYSFDAFAESKVTQIIREFFDQPIEGVSNEKPLTEKGSG
jgi:hypothetical protein